MDVKKTIKNMELRGFPVKFFATGEEAAEYLCSEIKDTTVGIGGSKTAEQLGLFDKLSENNTVYWHWRNPGHETLIKENEAAVFISSANAIAETGEILNIDGRGNRLAGQVFGKKKTYIVSGTNKICPDFDSALYRARNVASPLNARRLGMKTPCATGELKCHDCSSPQRICGGVSTLLRPMFGIGETEVILINEELGY